jgi:hypothetical protein
MRPALYRNADHETLSANVKAEIKSQKSTQILTDWYAFFRTL